VTQLKRWQTVTLIILQLLFAACAASVLIYNALAWAPKVIDFRWLSYRAFNIYASLALIAYIVRELARREISILPALAVFALFHLIEGIIVAFWSKAVIHFATLILLAWFVYERKPGSSLISTSGQ
jgi:hypothetical protein